MTRVMTPLLLAAAVHAAHALPQLGSSHFSPSERIYFHSWTVGEQCSSKIPGCHAAAKEYLTNTRSFGYSSLDIQIFSTIGFSETSGEPVDLTTQGMLLKANYKQVGAVCRSGAGSESVSLTVMPNFTIHESSGGCLGKGTTAARAFIAARITVPAASGGMLGGAIKGCPKGLCVIGLHAPAAAGDIAPSAAGLVRKVCGADVVPACTVAVGEFGDVAGSINPTEPGYDPEFGAAINAQFSQMGLGKVLSTHGVVGARAALNVPGTGPGMDIGPVAPLQKQFGNVTGLSAASVMDVLLPCAHPNTFRYCKN